jgi:hypothetical protein
MEGIVALRLTALKHSAAVIGRHFDQMSELQAARADGLDRLFRRHSQFSFWSARFGQDNCFLAWALMPVDDREEPGLSTPRTASANRDRSGTP